jgi:toxin ParE1/3/4
MEVRWSPKAADDLERIVRYIQQQDSPEAARRVAQAIYARANGLQTFPNRGRPGRMEATRELALPPLPFIIVYRVLPEAVEIVRIIHGAQRWP